MAKIYGFGTATIDFRLITAELGEAYREKLLAQQTLAMGGGAVANCLCQISRLGGSASWLGKLGQDWIGTKIVALLEEEGVDCTHICYDSACCSPFNIAAYAGERRRRIGGFLIPNSLGELNAEDIERFAAPMKTGDWLVVEVGETRIDDILHLVSLAQAKGIRIAVDVDLDPIVQCAMDTAKIEKLFVMAGLLMPNRAAMQTLFPEENARELVQALSTRYACDIVVTAGADGCFFQNKNMDEPQRQPAFPTQAVDTVGAGDAFHGGLLFGLSQKFSLEKSVKLASFCGAYNCRTFGARAGMLQKEQLQQEADFIL
jgi:sulfofructose kinase